MGVALLPLRDVEGYFDSDKSMSSQFWLPLSASGDLGEIKVAVAIVDNDKKKAPTPEQKKSYPGHLELKIIKATHLKAADLLTSDPFCVAAVGLQRQKTTVIKETLNPVWSGDSMHFPVTDLFGCLDIVVYDQDAGGKSDFLGRVMIPLSDIRRHHKGCYALKDQNCVLRGKGEITIEMWMVLNDQWAARKALFDPVPEIPEDRTPKLTLKNSSKHLRTTANRIALILGSFRVIFDVLIKIMKWEYGLIFGIITMIMFVHVCLNFRLWMLPLLILVVFVVNLIRKSPRAELVSADLEIETTEYDDDDDDISSEEEDEDEEKDEPKFTGPFSSVKKYKAIYADVQQKGQVLQQQIGFIASSLERVDKYVGADAHAARARVRVSVRVVCCVFRPLHVGVG